MRLSGDTQSHMTQKLGKKKLDNEFYDGGKGTKINRRNKIMLNFFILMSLAFFSGIAVTRFRMYPLWFSDRSTTKESEPHATLEHELRLLSQRMAQVQDLSTKLLEEETAYISNALEKSKFFLQSEYKSLVDHIGDNSHRSLYIDPTAQKSKDINHSSSSSLSSSTSSSSLLNNLKFIPFGTHVDEKNTELDEKGSAVLMVGGSDGSGTRSAVDILQKLGVAIAVDDTGTMDVHGQEMKGGWPPSVTKVLKATHSGNYEVKDLSLPLQNEIIDDLSKFFSVKSRIMSSKVKKTSKVNWGFKAPVSMLLVPFFHHMTNEKKQGLKFLHMIRDGRDLAFSGNQSPVRKFYDTFYDGNPYTKDNIDKNEDAALKAIRLWSDWNTEVAKWASSHVDGVTFDYLQIRTEDLIHQETKYDAYKRIAHFVGSPYTDEQICCMVAQPTKFMGSHSTTGGNLRSSQSLVQSRYGHWKEKVAGNVILENKLQSLGQKGLHEFGYLSNNQLPPQGVKYPASQCTLSKEDCRNVNMKPKIIKENDKERVRKCRFYQGPIDIRGPKSIDLGVEHGSSKEECCIICQEHSKCKQFTFNRDSGLCYLKTSGGTQTSSSNAFLESGSYV